MMRVLIIFLPFTLFALGASAQRSLWKDSTDYNPRVYFTAGIYSPEVYTSIRFETTTGSLGTVFSLEDDLNLASSKTIFRSHGMVRVGRRSQIELGFMRMRRTTTSQVGREIQLLDTSVFIGATMETTFNQDYYTFNYRYSIFEKQNWNAGVTAGLRFMRNEIGLQATFLGKEYGDSYEFPAPAPVIGLHGSAYLTPRLLGRYSFNYFSINLLGMDFDVVEARTSLEYYFIKNAALGAAYSRTVYSIDDVPYSDTFKARLNYQFGGFRLYLAARF